MCCWYLLRVNKLFVSYILFLVVFLFLDLSGKLNGEKKTLLKPKSIGGSIINYDLR